MNFLYKGPLCLPRASSTLLRHPLLIPLIPMLPLRLQELLLLLRPHRLEFRVPLFLLLLIAFQLPLLGLFFLVLFSQFPTFVFAGRFDFADYLGAKVGGGDEGVREAEEVGEDVHSGCVGGGGAGGGEAEGEGEAFAGDGFVESDRG